LGSSYRPPAHAQVLIAHYAAHKEWRHLSQCYAHLAAITDKLVAAELTQVRSGQRRKSEMARC
jgi:hypothetical protein